MSPGVSASILSPGGHSVNWKVSDCKCQACLLRPTCVCRLMFKGANKALPESHKNALVPTAGKNLMDSKRKQGSVSVILCDRIE